MSRLLLSPGDHSKTLVELLRRRASERPDQKVFTFLEDGENESSSLSFSELDRRARAVGAFLQQHGLQGERALLLFPSGLDFIAAFFGCLYAGVVAVPAYPPRSLRAFSKLKLLMNDAKPGVLLIDSSLARRFDRWGVQDLDVPWINVDEVDQSSSGDWRDPDVSSDTLAFLQYTSGSTATPKGVMVTHRNVLHNEGLIKTAFQQGENSVVVGWLPLYHDMGLIGNVLQPIYSGSRCVLMPPMAFLQRPFRWLRCISRYGATTSGGPNFAYELCVDKINDDERQDLSLDTWKVAFNGAEPVRATTLNRFAEAFEPFGFRRSAFYPCYGLAEATLLVSSSGFSSGGERLLVSSGQFVEPDSSVIVNPQTMRRLEPGETGEIWLQSQSVAQGYWNRPDETERTFHAYLSDESGRGPFLRTGDLGLVENGQVFITGRLKDLIIIRGRNFYPQDIELTVEQSHPALRLGVSAAFSVDGNGSERLVLTQEIESQALDSVESISLAARKAVADEYQVHLDEIVYVRAGTLPRTTSGKIQRHLCRERYLSKGLKTVAVSEAVSTLEDVADLSRESLSAFASSEQRRLLQSHIRALVARLLKTRPELIGLKHSLLSSGLDSLMTIELQHRLEEQFEVNLPQFGDWSITSLAEEVVGQLAVGGADAETRTDGDAETCRRGDAESPFPRVPPSPRQAESTHKIHEFPLSYGQQALWFLHKLAPEAGAYNLAAAVSLNGPLQVSALREAFQTLTARHAVLRTNFREKDGQPVQWVHAEREVCFEEMDALAWDEKTVDDRLATEAYRPFDLETDPLLRICLFNKSADSYVLLLVVHHIIADFYSLEILLSELTTLYRHNVTQKQVALEPLTRNYADYVQWQRQMLSNSESEKSFEYWRERLSGELPVLNLPTKRVRPPVQTYRGAATNLTVNAEVTERLSNLARAQDVTLYTLLLTAFQVLLQRYTGQDDLIVGTPAAGRGSHEFADVTGYFVNPVPMRIDLTGNPSFSELLKQSGQTVRESLKHQDYPFPLLVEQLECARDPSRSPIFQAMFVLQQTTRTELRDLAGLAIGMAGARMQIGELELQSVEIEQRTSQFDLTLLAAEHGGGLWLRLQYNTDLFDGAMVERLLAHYRNLLQSVVADAGQSIRELSLLTSEETHELVVDLNDTARSFPAHHCMHELFEAQAERTPDTIALICDDQSISYQDLNRRANHVADRLHALGLVPEDRVAILMDRSVEMVVAILGALKAGAAYVPI
ncbi:MAG TPA: condensation domain-containing protein, partial [Pyrinomonadaceae bacterium]|nr:condensation domain-containing protein [Pyrinomonadaceae bacterium]